MRPPKWMAKTVREEKGENVINIAFYVCRQKLLRQCLYVLAHKNYCFSMLCGMRRIHCINTNLMAFTAFSTFNFLYSILFGLLRFPFYGRTEFNITITLNLYGISHRKCIYSIGKCPISNSARHRENNNKHTRHIIDIYLSYDAFLFLIWHCLFLLLWTYFFFACLIQMKFFIQMSFRQKKMWKKSTQM